MTHKFNPEKIKLVFGLGNPGARYKNTYHNLGLIILDAIIKKLDGRDMDFKNHHNFEYLTIGKIVFIKPKIFMNESGMATKSALNYFRAKPEEIIIIHDDSDLIFRNYKLSFNRGSAGHKGVQSIIDALKSQKIWRLRIGARNEKNKTKAGQFVLQPINQKDKEKLEVTQDKVFSNLYKIPK